MKPGRGQDLVEVRLLDCPVDLYRQAQEHHEALKREFALLAWQDQPADQPGRGVAGRLLAVGEELRARYGPLTSAQQSELSNAVRRGQASIDLSYRVPEEVAEAAAAMGRLLDEVDDLCARGELLTTATPEHLVRFRRWYLGEFVAQLAGRSPTAWPRYAALPS